METIAAPQAQEFVQAITGIAGGLFAFGAALLIFRTTIKNFVAGILFKRGAELKLEDGPTPQP